jgi:hypothetical protein
MSTKRNKFLTSTKVYNDRLEICKACEFYFKPTGSCKKCGCFMRLKAKISNMSCPIKKWIQTGVVEIPEDVDPLMLKEVLEIVPLFKNNRAPDHKVKEKAIELYNMIHGANHPPSTNCSSCLHQVFQGLNLIYKKYSDE